MILVMTRVLLGCIAVVALALAVRHIVRNWHMTGKEYLTIFLTSVALDNLFTSLFFLMAAFGDKPIVFTWQSYIFVGVQIATTLTACAFSAFLLGLIGQDKVK